MLQFLLPFALPLLGYLVGSVSSAVIVSKIMGLPDPRRDGSGNPGATNVLRLGGKTAAIITLIGDVLKGVVPVLIARWLDASDWVIAITGVMAFIGHLYPLFFGFKGGKGVATAMGVFAAWTPWLGLAILTIWILFAGASRYSSLGSLVAMGLAPVVASILAPGLGYLAGALVIGAFVYIRHRENIKRLRTGTESKIKLSRS